MASNNLRLSILFVFILSLSGIGIWLFEILQIKGWYGLSWLSGSLYSPYIGTLLAAMAFVIPFALLQKFYLKKLILPALILYAVNVFCFEAGKFLCCMAYCRFCIWSKTEIIAMFVAAIVLFAFLGFAHWLVVSKLIIKNKLSNFIPVFLLSLSAIPLSLISIQLNSGFGSGTDWVDAVKMGYPVFWTILALGLSGIKMAGKRNKGEMSDEKLK